MLEVDWRRNWVIYPLPRTQEMQTVLKGQRLVIYDVTAPLNRRLTRSGLGDDLQRFCEVTSVYERTMLGDQSIPLESTITNDFATVTEFYAALTSKGYNFAD